MSASGFFRAADAPAISQGDIFASVPLILFPHPAHLVRKVPFGLTQAQYKKLPTGAESCIREPVADLAAQPSTAEMAVRVKCGVGILITHSCECDKPRTKYLAVAAVRPLSSLPPEGQATVTRGQKFSFFHVPSRSLGGEMEKQLGGDGFVDFATTCLVGREYLQADRRLASLSDEAVASMLAQLIAYYARINVPGAHCPGCDYDFTIRAPDDDPQRE